MGSLVVAVVSAACSNTTIELRPRPVTTEHHVLARGRVLTARLVERGRQTEVCVESHAQCRDVDVVYVDRYEITRSTQAPRVHPGRARWLGAYGVTEREAWSLCDPRPTDARQIEVHDDAGFTEAPTDGNGCAVLTAVARGIKFVTANGERVTVVSRPK